MRTLKPRGLGFLLTAVLVLSIVAVTLASNVHFVSGPSFTDSGLTLTAGGKVAGLGGEDLTISMAATANPVATCTNPAGATQPPGQNPAPVTLSGSESASGSDVKNGTFQMSVTTSAPSNNPIAGAPDCPNSKWTEQITDLIWTSAVITIRQPSTVVGSGPVVLTETCSLTDNEKRETITASCSKTGP